MVERALFCWFVNVRRRCLDGDGLGTKFAARGGNRNIAEALRARLGGGGGRATKTKQKRVDGKDDEEVDGTGDQEEGDRGVEEIAVLDDAAVDRKGKGGEIWFADNGSDEGINYVGNKGVDNAGEGSADDDGDCEVDHVAAEDEVTKTFEHEVLPGI